MQELSQLPSFAPCSLVGIRLNLSGGLDDYKGGDYRVQWKAIDSAFCDPKFSRLISIEIRDGGYDEAIVADWHVLFQEISPMSYKRGILQKLQVGESRKFNEQIILLSHII